MYIMTLRKQENTSCVNIWGRPCFRDWDGDAGSVEHSYRVTVHKSYRDHWQLQPQWVEGTDRYLHSCDNILSDYMNALLEVCWMFCLSVKFPWVLFGCGWFKGIVS